MVLKIRSNNRKNFQEGEFEEQERLHRIRKEEFELISHMLGPGPIDERLALDVGCGDGYQAGLLTTKFETVVAVDIAKAEVCQKLDLLSDARFLPFVDSSFDMILLSNVLEHIRDRQKVVKECLRVLRDGGTLVVTVPSALWKLTEIRDYYFNVLFAVLRGDGQSDGKGNLVDEEERPRVDSGTFLRFFLPPIHGSYRSNFEELFAYSVSSWNMIFEDISVQPLITIRLPLYPSRKWNLPRLRLLLGVLGFSSSNCFVFRNHRENGRPPVEPLLSIISHLY
jgi:SAM-dependent methyltransferase